MAGLRVGVGNFELPTDVAGEAIAILAKRGAGKTNTAIVLAEEMYEAGIQFVVLDPVGAWWGLRSKLEVPIIGGGHADLALEPTAGKLLADVLVESGQSLVIDTTAFASKKEVARFVTDFLGHLYRLVNREPRLLHVFLEEADEFAPQKPFSDETRMLGAVEQVVRRGRGSGLGITMVSQRAAVLNKNVLEQADVLIAMRTTGPNDRKAIQGWIGKHDDGGRTDAVLASLAKLQTGQAVFWNPERDLFDQVTVRKRRTLDVSGRLRAGETRAATKMKAIDLDALGSRISETVEKQKANDPAELRKQVRELEQKLRRAEAREPAPDAVETIEVPVVTDAQMAKLEQALAHAETFQGQMMQLEAAARDLVAEIGAAFGGVAGSLTKISGTRVPLTAGAAASASGRPTAARRGTSASGSARGLPGGSDNSDVDEPVKAGARRIVETLARHHPMQVTKAQLGTLTGFKITGGTFGTYYSQLRRLGLIDDSGGLITVTEKGIRFSGVDVGDPMGRDEMLDRWRQVLKKGAREMLDVVLAHPSGISRDMLAETVDMAASGGTFGTYLGTLRRNGLVDVDGDLVRPSTVFELV